MFLFVVIATDLKQKILYANSTQTLAITFMSVSGLSQTQKSWILLIILTPGICCLKAVAFTTENRIQFCFIIFAVSLGKLEIVDPNIRRN